MIPLWIKISVTAFVCILVPVYWVERGPANFLWMSDIALFVTTVALWRESRLLASAMALATLLPELAWNVDFFTRLIAGHDVIGLNGTGYMWDPTVSLFTRALSLFHVFLPIVLLWLVAHLGYDRRAFFLQTLLAWAVLLLSYGLTDPVRNINWVFGPGSESLTWASGMPWLVIFMLAMPLLVYLPTHLFLAHCFSVPGTKR